MEFPLVLVSLFVVLAGAFAVLALIATGWRYGGMDHLPVGYLWFMSALFGFAAITIYAAAFVVYPALKELLL